MKSRRYLVDSIFKAGKVHLLGGPSGSGKSTWLLETIALTWAKGDPVLGYESHPAPWAYISADRSTDSVLETMERIGIPEIDVRIYSMTDTNALLSLGTAVNQTLKLDPRPELLIIEGLASLMPSAHSHNNYQHVAKFLQIIGGYCDQENITIIGVVHSSKAKQGEEFLNPRQRVLGSVAWAAYSETVMLIEPLGLEQSATTPLRRLYVLPRQSKEFSVDMQLDERGRLRPVEVATDDLASAMASAFLGSKKPNETFSTADFLDQVAPASSVRTAERILGQLEESGQLIKVCKGRYRKPNAD